MISQPKDLVEVVNICGEERLLYKAIHVDVALIRATYADEYGNITMEHECCTAELLRSHRLQKTVVVKLSYR